MKRILVTVIGLIGFAAVLVGCSGGDVNTPGTKISTGSGTEVQVDGKPLSGLDTNSVTCVKQAGKINVASSAIGGQQGLAVVMTDESTPKVESLAMVVDGNSLAVSNIGGVGTGSADVKVDGSTYTISGTAVGTDIKNPLAGAINKPFTIKVSCG